MKILNYLCAEAIDTDFKASSKEEVLKKLSSRAAEMTDDTDARQIYQILLEREQLGTTGIGGGIAIPHGKIPGLKKLNILLARCREGVPFDSMDSQPVYLIVVLLAPDDATTKYLKILARVSRVCKMDGVVERIRDADDVMEIKQIIAEAESRL